jgi:hypothetical protein
MKSPFPGMDPYLERHWGDVHTRLIIYSSDRLRPFLPAELRPRIEERVFVESFCDNDRDEPVTEHYLNIIDVRSGGRVVTTIEFLSLSNKVAGDGRNLYLQKQHELRMSSANSVEFDLLRDGKRTFAIPYEHIPQNYRLTYGACIRRASAPLQFALFRFPLRDRLPAIAIPLRETDADVPLDLQALIEQCYENAGYDTIDFTPIPTQPAGPTDYCDKPDDGEPDQLRLTLSAPNHSKEGPARGRCDFEQRAATRRKTAGFVAVTSPSLG